MATQCKKRDIDEIYNWCEKYADEDAKKLIGTQPSTHIIAYYTPSQANWSYQIGIVQYEGNIYEVVLVFGVVKAVRIANIPRYTSEELEERRF